MNPQFFDQYRAHIVNKIADKLEYAPALKPGPIARLFRREDPNAERAVALHATAYHFATEQLASIAFLHPEAPSIADPEAFIIGIVTDAITLFRSRNPQPKPK